MGKISEKIIWVAIMAILAALGWVLLLSPWAEWAPAGARWPSMVIAFLFGQTAFLSFSYYPLFALVILAPLALGVSPGGRPHLRDPFFLNGAIFLAGFTGIFALQSMAILPVKAHGAGSGLWGERLAAGLFVLTGAVSMIHTLRRKPAPVDGKRVYPIFLGVLIFLLGIGWGVYYGHDLDLAYDRMHFRAGAGPGSHETAALALFGAGLLSLQALWTWGAGLWLRDVLARKSVHLGAGVLMALFGASMIAGFHPF